MIPIHVFKSRSADGLPGLGPVPRGPRIAILQEAQEQPAETNDQRKNQSHVAGQKSQVDPIIRTAVRLK